jgi:hypothetical protein
MLRPFVVLLLVSILATSLALPIPSEHNPSSITQHLAHASLWALSGLATLGFAIGGIVYGTHWWDRLESIRRENDANMLQFNATMEKNALDHKKKMEALDVLLDLVEQYSDKTKEESRSGGFNPVIIENELEQGFEEAKSTVESVDG